MLASTFARHYKPDPDGYPGSQAASLLGLEAFQCILVAAHNQDIVAAKAVGFHTAFVNRTEQYGQNQTKNLAPDPLVDQIAKDFHDLAEQLNRETDS